MAQAAGTKIRILTASNGLRNVCTAGVAAILVAASWGATPPSEVARPHVGQVLYLEATLAASVVSTIDSHSEPARSNSLGAETIPTASDAVISDPARTFVQGLAFAGGAALLTPIWYIGFPVTIPLTAAFVFVLLSPLVAAEGGTVGLGLAGVAVAFGVVGYALLPPAAILGGLALAGQALSQARSQTATATATATATNPNAKRVASATRSRTTPTSTGHSARDVAGPDHQSLASARSRVQPAAAVPSKRSNSPTAVPSSKKSTAGGPAKRAVGSSGRDR